MNEPNTHKESQAPRATTSWPSPSVPSGTTSRATTACATSCARRSTPRAASTPRSPSSPSRRCRSCPTCTSLLVPLSPASPSLLSRHKPPSHPTPPEYQSHLLTATETPPSWGKNRNAIIQETLRIHPNTGTILERRAPAPHGAVIDGYRVPAGTVVGVNAWVLHRDRGVYGADADAFRPERWLEADEEARVEMSRCLFSVRPVWLSVRFVLSKPFSLPSSPPPPTTHTTAFVV